MAILDDLQALYDNGWDASFNYNGQVCGIFPNSVYDIVVVIADKEYRASSFDDLISLQIEGKTLLEIMNEVESTIWLKHLEKSKLLFLCSEMSEKMKYQKIILTVWNPVRFLYCPSIEDSKSYGKYSRGRL